MAQEGLVAGDTHSAAVPLGDRASSPSSLLDRAAEPDAEERVAGDVTQPSPVVSTDRSAPPLLRHSASCLDGGGSAPYIAERSSTPRALCYLCVHSFARDSWVFRVSNGTTTHNYHTACFEGVARRYRELSGAEITVDCFLCAKPISLRAVPGFGRMASGPAPRRSPRPDNNGQGIAAFCREHARSKIDVLTCLQFDILGWRLPPYVPPDVWFSFIVWCREGRSSSSAPTIPDSDVGMAVARWARAVRCWQFGTATEPFPQFPWPPFTGEFYADVDDGFPPIEDAEWKWPSDSSPSNSEDALQVSNYPGFHFVF